MGPRHGRQVIAETTAEAATDRERAEDICAGADRQAGGQNIQDTNDPLQPAFELGFSAEKGILYMGQACRTVALNPIGSCWPKTPREFDNVVDV
jgi:hypothetical protein